MRRVLIAVVAVILTAVRAQEAFAQCTISYLEINGVVTLCADGGDGWQWTGPGSFSSGDFCITAAAPGTYTLRTYDSVSGTWSEPCSRAVGTPPPPACSIAGSDSVCADAAVDWCGPSGDVTYSWTGPGGFAATSACVTVSAAGTYSLSVTDRMSGVTGGPCSKTLYAQECTTHEPPQPPPAPPRQTTCPAPPRWWSLQCDPQRAQMNAATFAQVAQQVDASSAVWSFSGEPSGLCALLSPKRHGRPFHSARRQFAAVHANMAAAKLGATSTSGQAIGLSGVVVLEGVRGVPAGTTLGEWVAATETALLAMGDGSSRSRSMREECQRIRREAREINVGMRRNGCRTALYSMLDEDDEEDDDLLSGGGAALISGGGPNPFSGGLRWTLERSGEVQLDILDLSGRRVRHLVNGQFAAGTHEFQWNGRDDSGRSLEPGAYFVTGRIAETRVAQRLILIK